MNKSLHIVSFIILFNFCFLQPCLKAQEVTFLETAPVIDGKPDTEINLPERQFPFQERTDPSNPQTKASYTIGYGATFLYLYIKIWSDSLIRRDRAYQNGDGFHMVLAKPEADGAPAREFYVLGFSPAADRSNRQRKFVWYRNIDLAFTYLKEAQMESNKEGEITGFELLLPWKEVYPYHPWITEKIGFNLCFVKAVGEKEKNYLFVRNDDRIQSEQSLREYIPLFFSAPIIREGSQTWAQPSRNHITRDESLNMQFATASSTSGMKEMTVQFIAGEGDPVMRKTYSFDYESGLIIHSFSLPYGQLVPGGYRIRWKSPATGEEGETELTIFPPYDSTEIIRNIRDLSGVVRIGTVNTLLYRAEAINQELRRLKTYETAPHIRESMEQVTALIRIMKTGYDPVASQTGIFRRAYRSTVDKTLQPYSIKVPIKFDPARNYPLFVFLHGSGQDDRGMLEGNQIPGDDFICVAPSGRGTSNVYSADHAQEDIEEVIRDVISNYPIDTTRIILAGFSMGGYGVYRTFWEHPERYRALAVFSGHPNLANQWLENKHPDFTREEYLKPFRNKDIFIFHGTNDLNCPFAKTVALVEKLKQHGARVLFLSEEAGHDAPGEKTLSVFFRWMETTLY